MSIEPESQSNDDHQIVYIERGIAEIIRECALFQGKMTTMWELGMVTGALPEEAREALMGLYWQVLTSMKNGQDLTIKIQGTKMPEWMQNLEFDID